MSNRIAISTFSFPFRNWANTEVIAPGALCQNYSNNGSAAVRNHSVAGGTSSRLFAIEVGFKGPGITMQAAFDSTISYPIGSSVVVGIFSPGDEIYALLTGTAQPGDNLSSNGDGTLRVATGDDTIIGFADEAGDFSVSPFIHITIL